MLKTRKIYLAVLIILAAISGWMGYKWMGAPAPKPDDPEFYVSPTDETEPMPYHGDSADDPAIWYNALNPALSTIIGTDKLGGLAVYDLSGDQIQYLPDGQFNNVDVRSGFIIAGESVSLVTAGNRADSSVYVYKINPVTRALENVAARKIKTVAPYGSCMYRSAVTGRLYFIVTAKSGAVEQWELFESPSRRGKVDAQMVRTFKMQSTPEGCVADDDLGHLYLAEQQKGIWKYGAEPGASNSGVLIDSIGPGGHLTPQVEGLGLYRLSDGRGYLVASSQGSNEFVLYRREGNNAYVHTFEVKSGNGIDEVTHTDGLAVSSRSMGDKFPEGLLVVQDHVNDQYPQNFKLVSWQVISKQINNAKSKPATKPQKGNLGTLLKHG